MLLFLFPPSSWLSHLKKYLFSPWVSDSISIRIATLKYIWLGPTPGFWFTKAGYDLRTCMSSKFQVYCWVPGPLLKNQSSTLFPVLITGLQLHGWCKWRPFQKHPPWLLGNVFQQFNQDAMSQNSCGPLFMAKEMK